MALKSLLTSVATIAVLGCSNGADEAEGPSPRPFSGILSQAPAGTGQPSPSAADPAPSTSGAGEAPAAGPAPSEGQNPDNISIASPAPSGAEAGGSEASTAMGAGGQPATGEQPSTVAPPVAPEPVAPPVAPEPAAPEPEPVVEPEPEPIVRPALNCAAPAPALQGAGVQGCAVNDQGNVAEQSWFLWYQGGNNNCMTPFENLSGAFRAQWNGPSDFLARIGFWFDETQTFEELGEIGADLRFTRQGNAGGFSFIGIYGWTTDPLVEYYIVEDSFGNGPAQPFNTQQRGNFTVDGGQYNIYSGARVNLPSINGNADFTQVLSVRQGPRQCGHVSISEHFRQWQRMGINLGNAKEAKVLVEAGGGNGSITFTHANVTVTPPE